MCCVFPEIQHFNMAEGRVSLRPRMCSFFFVGLNLGTHVVSWSGRSLCNSCGVNRGYLNEVVWCSCITGPPPCPSFFAFPSPFLITKCSHRAPFQKQSPYCLFIRLMFFSFLFGIDFLSSPPLPFLHDPPRARLLVFSSCELEDSWGWPCSPPCPAPALHLWLTLGWPGVTLCWCWVDCLYLPAGKQGHLSPC